MANSFDIVIFGGSGDLSIRKLMPALYRCEAEGKFSDDTRIFAASRSTSSSLRDKVLTGLEAHLKQGELSISTWEKFSRRLNHLSVDLAGDGKEWATFAEAIAAPEEKAVIFYFAIPANLYGATSLKLSNAGLIKANARVVLEKPIGYDLESSKVINAAVAEYFSEAQIFRIDHYLGKETAQNLLALRFTNVLFEHLWDNKTIDNVQITIAEKVGLEGRATFYDQAGALRDMVQNHLLQLFSLVAMEPPNKMTAENIRAEKLKVMEALRPMNEEAVRHNTVAGQYTHGEMDGEERSGYLDELGNPNSATETFVAIRAYVDNWRWAGVPFYFRTGKRMKEQFAEIAIQYKPVSHLVYGEDAGRLMPNSLVIRLQPEESIKLTLMTKKLNSTDMRLKPVDLDLDFSDTFERRYSDAYKRLLLDVVEDNPTLFAHRGEVEQAWDWLTPVLEAWAKPDHKPSPYASGSWGPVEAKELLSGQGRRWHGD